MILAMLGSRSVDSLPDNILEKLRALYAAHNMYSSTCNLVGAENLLTCERLIWSCKNWHLKLNSSIHKSTPDLRKPLVGKYKIPWLKHTQYATIRCYERVSGTATIKP